MATRSLDEPPHDLTCLTIGELEKIAADKTDKQTRDYYSEGADSGLTLSENTEAYKKYRIRPRVLRDMSAIDTSTLVFGHRNSIPMGVAPTAMHCFAHSDGELATARACRNKNVIMGLSSFSTHSLEDVAKECGDHPRVLQLYLMEERGHSRDMINRAKKAGYKAVFLTVDTPMLGRRNEEIRNQFSLPKPFKVANFDHSRSTQKHLKSEKGYFDGQKRRPPEGPVTFHTHAPNPTLNWDDHVGWLKKVCKPELEVWVKGVMTGEDAELAVQHGVDGIVVSNHGGRQLDGALSTIDALPEVVEAVHGRLPVHVDGGIRHGTDVFKALALGAQFTWVGRPALWGLAYKGQEGVEHALRLYQDEIKLCMGLAGTVKTTDIHKDYLVKVDKSGFVARL